jgi:ArsR family transcriptional regulator
MNTKLRQEIDRLHAELCGALSDPNRILILYTLSEETSNVSDLADKLNMPQPTTSRHLKILRERGMVAARRKGQSVIYRLADNRIIAALDLLRSMLADKLEMQAALVHNAAEQLNSLN